MIALRRVAVVLISILSIGSFSSASAGAQEDSGAFVPHSLDDVARGPGFGESDADVLRLYRAFFDREADVDGALFWLTTADGGASLAAIADSFAASPEFEARYGELDDDSFVGTVYGNVLGRDPDADGAAFWISELDAGRSRGEVVGLIANAVEFEAAHPYPATPTTTVDQIVRSPQFGSEHAEALRLYQAFLGRPPDVDGAAFWLRALENGFSVDDVAEAFAASPEFASLTADPGDSAFVDRVYRNVLGRAPDADGVEFWIGELAAGRSRASVVQAFAGSPEFVAAHPFQMAGVDSLAYACGLEFLESGEEQPRVMAGSVLDRLDDQPTIPPFSSFDFSKPWLASYEYVDVGLSLERSDGFDPIVEGLAMPLLNVEPPHLNPRFDNPCRPEQVSGPADGGWLDRSLRRQRGDVGPPPGSVLECLVFDDVTGPTTAILGVADRTPVQWLVDGQVLVEKTLLPQSAPRAALIEWQAERGIVVSNASTALPVGGGPGDPFEVTAVVGGVEIPCGTAARIAELPSPQPFWECRVDLAGVLPQLNVNVPSYLGFEIVRDGELTGLTRDVFLGQDPGAQFGATHRYQLLLRGDGQPNTFMECGSVTVPPNTPQNRIVAARDTFFALPSGPYLYGSINVIDDGVATGPVDIGNFISDDLTADFFAYEVVIVDGDRNPIDPPIDDDHPGILAIQEIYDALLAALDADRDVEMMFNDKGVPVRWTIDGDGFEYLCFEGDTAPPELRSPDGPWCNGDLGGFLTLVPR